MALLRFYFAPFLPWEEGGTIVHILR